MLPFYGKYAARECCRRGGFLEQQRAHETGQNLNCLGLWCPWGGVGGLLQEVKGWAEGLVSLSTAPGKISEQLLS